MDKMLTIGRLAALTGVTVDTIRYYERIRVLPRPERTPAGYRVYPPRSVYRLNVIRSAQRFGFSLRQIATFLQARDSGGKPCHQVRAAAERLLDGVDDQIKDLVAARKQMRRTLHDWDGALARRPANEPAYLLDRLASTRERR